MSYVTKLIGNLEPGKMDGEGNLSVPPLYITEPQIRNPKSLRDEFGTLGRGLEQIISSPHINKRLLGSNTSELLIESDQVQGLDNLLVEEQRVVQELLTRQHHRSGMIYRLASNEELSDYDGITKGVFKGTILGGILGGTLTLLEYAAGATGVAGATKDYIGEWFNKSLGIATEISARAGPGLAEVAGISSELLGEDDGENSDDEKNIKQLVQESLKEFPGESINIAKTGVSKKLWYGALNVGGGLDKVRGKEPKARRDSYTEVWAEGGETGPARGILMLTGIRGLREALPFDEYSIIARTALDLADVFATTYISVGNNLQAGVAVLGKYIDDARKDGSPTPYRDGLNEFMSDPLQVSNLYVVAGFNIIKATALFGFGFRPEAIGPIGAAMENTVMSWDTGIMAQLSKPISTSLVVRPAKKSVEPYNLMNLAIENEAISLHTDLMAYSGGRRAFYKYLK